MQKLWPFEYEPKSVDEMVLSHEMKDQLKQVIKDKPNVLLSGSPGTGKGCFTNIFIRETGLDKTGDIIRLNASDTNSIDDIRSSVKLFATSIGVGDFKLVYLNEADRLSTAAQDSLRQLIEDVQAYTRFFFLVNHPGRITDAIHSRCQHIKFEGAPKKDVFHILTGILKNEGIDYSEPEKKDYIIKIIKTFYPDIRKCINALQQSVIDGEICVKSINAGNKAYTTVLTSLLDKDLDAVRGALRANPIDYVELYEHLYNNHEMFTNKGVAILLVGEYMQWHNTSCNPEINFMTMCVDFLAQKAV